VRQVLVSGVGIPPQRQQQIHGVLDRLPHVVVRFDDPAFPAGATPVQSEPAARDAAGPEKSTYPARIEERLGGRPQFERFSSSVLDWTESAMTRAYALRRLAQQFSAAAENQMSADDRREYLRQKQAEFRKRKHAVNTDIQKSTESTHTDPAPDPDPTTERSKPSRASRSAVDELPPTFLEFWRNYPKKKAKGHALKAWSKLSPPIDRVLAALEWQRNQPDWTRDLGQYIPHPATWLNSRSWEDEPFHPPAHANSNEPILSDKNRQTLTAVQRVIARRRAAQEAQ